MEAVFHTLRGDQGRNVLLESYSSWTKYSKTTFFFPWFSTKYTLQHCGSNLRESHTHTHEIATCGEGYRSHRSHRRMMGEGARTMARGVGWAPDALLIVCRSVYLPEKHEKYGYRRRCPVWYRGGGLPSKAYREKKTLRYYSPFHSKSKLLIVHYTWNSNSYSIIAL